MALRHVDLEYKSLQRFRREGIKQAKLAYKRDFEVLYKKIKVYILDGCECEAPIVNQDDRAESDCIWAPWSWIFGYW